jgi:hypothetical protein
MQDFGAYSAWDGKSLQSRVCLERGGSSLEYFNTCSPNVLYHRLSFENPRSSKCSFRQAFEQFSALHFENHSKFKFKIQI